AKEDLPPGLRGRGHRSGGPVLREALRRAVRRAGGGRGAGDSRHDVRRGRVHDRARPTDPPRLAGGQVPREEGRRLPPRRLPGGGSGSGPYRAERERRRAHRRGAAYRGGWHPDGVPPPQRRPRRPHRARRTAREGPESGGARV
ncbi:MAG: Methylmalonyl-CoA epimerase, partial [uncultured Rubrobacteraceae bacterium]